MAGESGFEPLTTLQIICVTNLHGADLGSRRLGTRSAEPKVGALAVAPKGIKATHLKMARLERFELPSDRVETGRFNPLSYKRMALA